MSSNHTAIFFSVSNLKKNREAVWEGTMLSLNRPIILKSKRGQRINCKQQVANQLPRI